MTTDIRVLGRERFARMKDAHTSVPKGNRHEKRTLTKAAQRHARLLEASRMRVAGQKDAADSAKEEGKKRTLKEEVAEVAAPAGFTRTKAGLLVPLAVAFELALAGCGSIVFDDEDAETDSAQDDVADVQQDEGPDTDAVEDEAADVQQDEGVGPDADVEDEGTDEATDAPDEADGDVEEDGGCEPTVYNETRPAVPSGSVCGIAKQKIVTVQVTEGCGMPRSTSLESVLFRVLGPLPADLTCARGEETEGLNAGVYLIVSLTPTELQMGIKLASALHVNSIGSGTARVAGGSYGITPHDISGGRVDCDLDYLGTFMREMGVWNTNISAIDLDNAAISWAISIPYASLGLIRTPLFVATNGGTADYEGLGDEGRFTVRINVDGAGSDDSWGFYRVHAKR
ncbi:MAG: hypothetical protein PHY95_04495 [Candidatus ainarchaeum sp.]|nr:hypothetical protein [Candidatus ainarchaeum sp.]